MKNKINIIFIILFIVILVVIAYNIVRKPNGYLLSFISSSPAKRFIHYEWDISAAQDDSVKGILTYDDGLLVLKMSGSGEMVDFNDPKNISAWHQLQNMTTGWYFSPDKIIIDEDVTYIGEYAFPNFSSIDQIRLPRSLKEIAHAAFLNCSSLNCVMFNGTKEEWNEIKLGKNWCAGTAIHEIECFDGTVEIEN
ncbi:MAG: leucine-rich repeat protein [Oliverpabstia sp.]